MWNKQFEAPKNEQDLINILSLTDNEDIEQLYKSARAVTESVVGKKVHFRGIIEFSNICAKDCYYCGIRKSNAFVERYTIPDDDIVEAAKWAWKAGYGSIVMQSGEIESTKFTNKVTDILNRIARETNGELGITLSLGEQSFETYKAWFDAGAKRYLLRIETTDRELYKTLHPADHSFDVRINALKSLRKAGYQVGTGVMIGLPGQTVKMLAKDILFFKEMDIDMIGMGPYIPHHQTPLADSMPNFSEIKDRQFQKGLIMIAATRLFLRDINIAASTALQTLNNVGRELGIMAGANIIMPNITGTEYRSSYQLYDNKPCLSDTSSMCHHCMEMRLSAYGVEIGLNEHGDSKHFAKRHSLG